MVNYHSFSLQEDEEETKRQEVLKAISRPGTVGPATPTIAEPTDADQKKSEEAQNDEASGEEIIPAESSDQELKKLMQQTDDAKVCIISLNDILKTISLS